VHPVVAVLAERQEVFRSLIEEAAIVEMVHDGRRPIPAFFAPVAGAAKMVPADLPPMRRTKVNAVVPVTKAHAANSKVKAVQPRRQDIMWQSCRANLESTSQLVRTFPRGSVCPPLAGRRLRGYVARHLDIWGT
jgi:hypothetical protein